MPNFKCKRLKKIQLPFKKDEVEFLWRASSKQVDLILVRFCEEEFFLQLSQDKINENFIIKGEKHFKPTCIGHLQKALLVFKEEFCEEIISEAVALKNNRLLKEDVFIANDFQTLLDRLLAYESCFIEIGFGSGRHLLHQAKHNPQTLIIGVEVYTPALEQVAKLAKSQELSNVLLIKSDARELLSILPSNDIDKIFLHFPVPWDKKAHRRVMSEQFAKECLRVLKSKGSFELRTDSLMYFEFSVQSFLAFKQIKACFTKNEELSISSKYEDRWKKLEKDIYDLRVICEQESTPRHILKEFKFTQLNQHNLNNFILNFKNTIYKGDDFFLHLENLYKLDEGAFVLKIVLGNFDSPKHCYLLLKDEVSFLCKAPFLTSFNLKALEKLQSLFQQS